MYPRMNPYSPSRQKKNLEQEKRTDNQMPALLERIFVDYSLHRYKFC